MEKFISEIYKKASRKRYRLREAEFYAKVLFFNTGIRQIIAATAGVMIISGIM